MLIIIVIEDDFGGRIWAANVLHSPSTVVSLMAILHLITPKVVIKTCAHDSVANVL